MGFYIFFMVLYIILNYIRIIKRYRLSLKLNQATYKKFEVHPTPKFNELTSYQLNIGDLIKLNQNQICP